MIRNYIDATSGGQKKSIPPPPRPKLLHKQFAELFYAMARTTLHRFYVMTPNLSPQNFSMLAWPPLQSLAVKKNFFLCKFWAVKNF